MTVNFRILTQSDLLFTRTTKEFENKELARKGAFAEKAFWKKRGFVCYFDIQEDPSGINAPRVLGARRTQSEETMYYVYDSIGRYLGTYDYEEAKLLCEDSEDTMVEVLR